MWVKKVGVKKVGVKKKLGVKKVGVKKLGIMKITSKGFICDDKQTDKQTIRQTDKQTNYLVNSIVYQNKGHSASGKKSCKLVLLKKWFKRNKDTLVKKKSKKLKKKWG